MWIDCRLIITFAILLNSTLNNVSAQCTTQVGQLSTPNFQKDERAFICYEDTFKVELSNYQLMEGQELYFLYHYDEDDIFDIHKIDTLITNGVINNRSTSLASNKLFVTAVATKSNTLFEIDDTCTVFSNTIEVNFLKPIIIEVDHSCNKSYNYEYANIKYVLEGGLPEIDSYYNYQLSGDLVNTLSYYQIDSIKLSIANTDDLYINITDGLCFSNTSIEINRCHHLPIEFLVFTGEVINEDHLIKWAMNGEVEISHFIIQISKDAINWETVDTVQGAGTTSQSTSYEILNKNILAGIYYYKLIKVDFDGTISHLGIVEVIQYATSVHPNPTNQYLNIHNNGQPFENLEISIADISGKKMANFSQNEIEISDLGYRLNVSFLSSGIYFLNIVSDDLQK